MGDFGYGWRLSMVDFVVQRNGPLGDGGWTQASCGDGFIYVPVCTTSTSPHLVTVRWPDGHVEAWDLEPEEGSSYFAMLTTAAFSPRPGTTSTLEPADGSIVAFFGGDLYTDIALTGLYDPQQYWLTARDGTMYLLDLDDGLVQMVDRNGNTTDFDEDGLTPLHFAAIYNQPDAVEALLRAGATPQVRDKDGLKPVDHAKRRRRRQIVSLLEGPVRA